MGNKRKRIRFNTGRPYTANGQSITATVVAEKEDKDADGILYLVLMVDHSRGLDYLYEMDSERFHPHGIMWKYDRNNSDISHDRLESFWNLLFYPQVWKLRKEAELLEELGSTPYPTDAGRC